MTRNSKESFIALLRFYFTLYVVLTVNDLFQDVGNVQVGAEAGSTKKEMAAPKARSTPRHHRPAKVLTHPGPEYWRAR